MSRAQDADLFTNPGRKESYLAVQYAKLYRERSSGFAAEVIQMLGAGACALVWDCVVVLYHFIEHPHPKFRLRWQRRLSIYTHIFSGASEIIFSVCSFLMYDEGLGNDSTRLRLVYATACCSFAHALTGAYQTPQVFGMQCVMVPVRQ